LFLFSNSHGNPGHAAHNFNFARMAECSSRLARIRMRNEGQYAVLDLAPSAGVTRTDISEVRGQLPEIQTLSLLALSSFVARARPMHPLPRAVIFLER
jgi:hypothetical protein